MKNVSKRRASRAALPRKKQRHNTHCCPQFCRIKITFGLLPTNRFVSTQTNSMKYLINWNPKVALRIYICWRFTQPHLKLGVHHPSTTERKVLRDHQSWPSSHGSPQTLWTVVTQQWLDSPKCSWTCSKSTLGITCSSMSLFLFPCFLKHRLILIAVLIK